MLKRLLGRLRGGKPLAYEDAKEMARHRDPEVRSAVAARADVKAEILYFLAEDPSPAVRRTVAGNATTPRQADLLLAGDSDDDVRCDLAVKIAKLAPGLSAHERDRIRRLTHEALTLLARDQVTRVRRVVAETLKDVADAPPDVIKRLARDAELVVAAPVLEFSPVLSDNDLLAIIAEGPIRGAAAAISRRRGVSEPVVDAVVAHNDAEAVAALLANPSAQIREETLDLIIDRAADQESWHEPLVDRPRLPTRAALRLAHMVADSLLSRLERRRDLDGETVAAVKAEVRRRLDRAPASAEGAEAESESPLAMARRMHAEGRLGEATLNHAVQYGDRAFALAGLAVLADMPLETVSKAVSMRSVKGTVALAWKAKLSMTLAVQFQQKVALIPPSEVLRPAENGAYPLTPEELEWQLSFFADLSGT